MLNILLGKKIPFSFPSLELLACTIDSKVCFYYGR